MDILPMPNFVTSQIGDSENIGSMNCVALANVDTFHYKVGKHFVR